MNLRHAEIGEEYMFAFADRDYAHFLLGNIDLDSQLVAIEGLLSRNWQADEEMTAKIKELGERARRTGGHESERMADLQVDHIHQSVYQDAAHSMAAVGTLAPLFETIFARAFDGIRKEYFSDIQNDNVHPRYRYADDSFWDSRYVFSNKRQREDRAAGIKQLADAIELTPLLPSKFDMTLKALFAYRNKMFHLGFEWPAEDRIAFQNRMTNNEWPSDWFEKATTDDQPWIFYMSREFVDHCLKEIDNTLTGLGKYAKTKMATRET